MKILINATPLLQPRTGIGQYIHNLFATLQRLEAAELHMAYGLKVVRGYSGAPALSATQSLWLRDLALKALPKPRSLKRRLEEIVFRYKTQYGLRGAIYHEPNYLPIKFDGPLVLTVCDMSCFDHPETHPRERVQMMHDGLPPALERADHIITISQDAKLAMQRLFRVPDEKITVTHLAASKAFRPIPSTDLEEPLGSFELVPKRYVLTVGTLEPRKNLPLLFAAFAKLPKTLRQRFPLVVVGMKGWKYNDLMHEAKVLVDDCELRFLGYVADAQMPYILSLIHM